MPRTRPTDHPVRPPFFWLSVAGALVGLMIVGVRIVTLPQSSAQPFAIAVAVAVTVTVIVVAAFALAIAIRMRAAARAFPHAVLIPVVVGTATAVATKWLATHLDDPALRLTASTYATIAIDATGVHIVRSAAGPHGSLAAEAVRVAPLGRTMIGMRAMDAIVLDVTVGAATAPLPLVPMRLRGNPLRTLTDLELIDVLGRIEDALAGRLVPTGWHF